jgi:hypothetical protein
MRNEWSKTAAKNARVDARERHLWLVKKEGSLRGVSIFDHGVIAALPQEWDHLPSPLACAVTHYGGGRYV